MTSYIYVLTNILGTLGFAPYSKECSWNEFQKLIPILAIHVNFQPAPPPPPQLGEQCRPTALPGPIARDVWAKLPPAMWHPHAGKEMANYLAVISGGAVNPSIYSRSHDFDGTTVLPTRMAELQEWGSSDPTDHINQHLRNQLVALHDEWDGQSFAFVGEQSDDHLPSTFLSPTNQGSTVEA